MDAPSPVPSGESILSFTSGSISEPENVAVTVVEEPKGNIDEAALMFTIGGGGFETERNTALVRNVSVPCTVQE